MPLLKIDHIVSFSSEDPVHVANNILSTDAAKKWKCRLQGEKNAVVVLQLEKASVITGIDIGNEHSAYVEILASRSENNDDYKVLLTMCSFMTALESRQSMNVNKVRMFTKDDLSKPESDEKWDRIKIVCTQPFNKHVQYGLNFIKFHSNDKVQATVEKNITTFALRPESPDNLSLGSLFKKQKEAKQEEKLTGAAAIREASSTSSLAIKGSPVCKPKLKTLNTSNLTRAKSPASSPKPANNESESPSQRTKPRNKHELFYTKDELESDEEWNEKNLKNNTADEELNKKNSKNNTDISKDKQKHTIKQTDIKESPKLSKDKNRNSKVIQDSDKKATPKRKHTDVTQENGQRNKKKKEAPRKPFNRLMEDVVLVISGIANPDRGNLRTMALSMGAKYKPDWDNSCTHLICAFMNTPKYNQVKGKGKIVTRNWIEECHSERKRLPWRRFALDRNDKKQSESEDEILEEVVSGTIENSDNDDFMEHVEEASDTEERLLEASVASIPEAGPSTRSDFEDVYSADTDIEGDCSDSVSTLPNDLLKNFFDNKKFYVDPDFEDEMMAKLNKYIVAYKGKVISELSVNPDVIVCSERNVQKLKELQPNAECVSPNWVWSCHNENKLVRTEEFLL